MIGSHEIIVGDCREVMAGLPEKHYQCCVTSPPYFGLRDYGNDEQIGLEPTPDDFVAAMVEVFAGVWRVLRDDGTLWLNLGDSYTGNASSGGNGKTVDYCERKLPSKKTPGLKPKDLIGIPWRVAFALQAEGWYLRDAVIWHKPAPMPGSQRDRCTSSYEFIFQLTKQPRYFFDMEAVKEAGSGRIPGNKVPQKGSSVEGVSAGSSFLKAQQEPQNARTPRNVWKIAHEGFNEAHFATFPRELPTKCIKASTSEKGCCPECGAAWARVVDKVRSFESGSGKSGNAIKGKQPEVHGGGNTGDIRKGPCVQSTTLGWEPRCGCNVIKSRAEYHRDPIPCRVLDPFNGAGTTGVAACLLGRDYTGIELNPDYAAMAERRIGKETKPGTYQDLTRNEPSTLFSGD